MKRKMMVWVAAMILPGGLIALLAGWLLARMLRTTWGARTLAAAKQRLPARVLPLLPQLPELRQVA